MNHLSEHKDQRLDPTGFAILVTSDSRDTTTDETGMNTMSILKASGHKIIAYEVVKNEESVIKEKALEFLRHDDVSVVITSGGTGISSRDRTAYALHELFSRRVEGFGELFRRLSYDEMGERAILSGAVAGVVGKKLVFCLPGSEQAVEMALKKIILPVLGHMLWEAAR